MRDKDLQNAIAHAFWQTAMLCTWTVDISFCRQRRRWQDLASWKTHELVQHRPADEKLQAPLLKSQAFSGEFTAPVTSAETRRELLKIRRIVRV